MVNKKNLVLTFFFFSICVLHQVCPLYYPISFRSFSLICIKFLSCPFEIHVFCAQMGPLCTPGVGKEGKEWQIAPLALLLNSTREARLDLGHPGSKARDPIPCTFPKGNLARELQTLFLVSMKMTPWSSAYSHLFLILSFTPHMGNVTVIHRW